MFQLNAPVVITQKVKKVQTNIAIYSRALLRLQSVSRNIGKLFYELKLITDHLLFVYASSPSVSKH